MPIPVSWVDAANVIFSLIGFWWFARAPIVECACTCKCEGCLRSEVVGGSVLHKDYIGYDKFLIVLGSLVVVSFCWYHGVRPFRNYAGCNLEDSTRTDCQRAAVANSRGQPYWRSFP